MEIDGEKVSNVAKFRIAVATAKIGVSVPVKIIRDNKEKTINIVLDAFPEDSIALGGDKPGKSTVATGISVEGLDSQFAKRMNITADKGVVVSSIDANSPASRSGLQVGFVIVSIDGIEVNSVNEFRTVLGETKDKMDTESRKTMRLYVIDRNKTPQFLILRFD